MKIAVCGCSFSAKVDSHPSTHWSELLAEKMGAELICLARQGISNGGIMLQIERAIRLKPDWIIAAATVEDRIEFPRDPDNRTEGKVTFDQLNYETHSGHVLVSETLINLIDGPCNRKRLQNISNDVREAAKQYAAFLYDANWQRQKDRWMLNSALWTMHDLNMKFLYNPYLNTYGPFDIPHWFVDRYFIPSDMGYNEFYHQYRLEGTDDPGYHISAEGQRLLAERYYELITRKSN